MKMKLTNANWFILFAIAGFCVISIAYSVIPKRVVSRKVTLQLDLPQHDNPVLGSLIARFGEENPDIVIVPVAHSYREFEELLMRETAGKNAEKGMGSDLLIVDMDWIPDLMKRDILEPLEAFPVDDSGAAMMYEMGKVDHESCAIPLFVDIYVFFYNIDALKAAGFDRPPKSREEFLRYGKALKERNLYSIGMALSGGDHSGMLGDIYGWFWSSGLSFVKDGKAQFQAKPFVETMSFLDSLNREALISPGSFTETNQAKTAEFCSGKTVMMIAPLRAVREINEKASFNWGLGSIPAADSYIGKPLFPAESFGIGIYKDSAHKEEAWKFITYLARAGINGELASGFCGIPKNQNAKAAFIHEAPQFEKAFAMLNSGEGVNEFDTQPGSFAVGNIVRGRIREMMLDGLKPEAAAKAMQEDWVKVSAGN